MLVQRTVSANKRFCSIDCIDVFCLNTSSAKCGTAAHRRNCHNTVWNSRRGPPRLWAVLLEEGHLEMATAETNSVSTRVRNSQRPTGIFVSFLNSVILGFLRYGSYSKKDINKYSSKMRFILEQTTKVWLYSFFHLSVRWGWVVKATPRKLYYRETDQLSVLQEAGWAPGPVWTGADNLAQAGIRFPDRPASSESLYRLSYLDPHK